MLARTRAEGTRRPESGPPRSDDHGVSFRAVGSCQYRARALRVIGRCIADSDVPCARLVIEVDGEYHATRRVADARRARELGRRGWRVLRLPAALVAQDLGEAVARVRAALGG